MNYKNKMMILYKVKTLLFAGLIAVMILSFSEMDFAEAEKTNIKTEMKQIHDKIKNADSSEKKQLKVKYLLKNQEFNDSIHKTLQRDYVSEWKTIDLQGMSLSEQRFTINEELKTLKDLQKINVKKAQIKYKDTKIKEILLKIDILQSEVIEFMKMDPVLEQNILDIISDLHAIYGDGNPDNAFVMAGIDYEQKELIVELTTEFDESVEFENTSIAIAEIIRSLAGENNVLITIDNLELTSCTNYLSICTPRVGGIAIARADDKSDLDGSIGYKAIKNGDIGYVTAGHVVDFDDTGNRAMVQPIDGSQISNGFGYPFTTNSLSGDVSFQKTSVSINDDLYYSGNTMIDVSSYATASNQHIGQFVYKMGAGSGLTWGYVTASYGAGMWKTSASTTTGDSGGPIYQIIGYSDGQYTGKVFGHTTISSSGNAVYQPTDKIIANYGIYPAIS